MTANEIETLAAGVRNAERRAVARAISLVESSRPSDAQRAEALLSALYGSARSARRVAVSGPPGVGKSTLIDVLGVYALHAGHRVAVLAIDPTSRVSGGSVLGDRTRMTELSRSPAAFVRSSPSGVAGGGISPRSHEVLCVLEAAGYDLIFVETVGVGQAELAAVDLVDVLLLVLLAGAGDDIQGIKRGILEHADVVAFNKCEGDNAAATEAARAQLAAVLSQLRAGAPAVFGVSALQQLGISQLFAGVVARTDELQASGELSARRTQRRKAWFLRRLEEAVLARFSQSDEARQRLAQLTTQVERGELLPNAAVRQLLNE